MPRLGKVHYPNDVVIPNSNARNQAQRVVDKLGGAIKLAALLRYLGHPRDVSVIRRWCYPKSRGGTGGFIPARMWPFIFQAARLEGIVISPEDMDPRSNVRHVDPDMETAAQRSMANARLDAILKE